MKPNCIKLKCITYPVCKNKQKINCDVMVQYYWKVSEAFSDHWEKWRIIQDEFPNVTEIKHSDGRRIKRRFDKDNG
jgi:hypothetical protein